MVWWLPVLGMHFKRWKWLPEEKNDPKNQVPRSSLKRSCGAVKRGWCSIVKSAVGLSSDWIWAVAVYQSVPWRSDRGCGVFWGAWQDRATVRSKPGLCLGSNFSTVWIFHASFPHRNPPYWNPRFSVCIKSRVRPWIWTFLCHVETIGRSTGSELRELGC
jgi:hypothetical protein